MGYSMFRTIVLSVWRQCAGMTWDVRNCESCACIMFVQWSFHHTTERTMVGGVTNDCPRAYVSFVWNQPLSGIACFQGNFIECICVSVCVMSRYVMRVYKCVWNEWTNKCIIFCVHCTYIICIYLWCLVNGWSGMVVHNIRWDGLYGVFTGTK